MSDMKKAGYSQEEEYFAKMNQELIEKRRKEIDARKHDRSSQPFWMVCPKCGTQLKEINLAGILVDKCSGCQGIFFDAGEIDTLTQSQEPKGFLSALKRKLT